MKEGVLRAVYHTEKKKKTQEQKKTARRRSERGDMEESAQLFSWKLAPQPRQVTVILPFPRGTRRCWPQLGHLK